MKNGNVKIVPPLYLTVTGPGDVEVGQMHFPVDTDDLMGQGQNGTVHRRYTSDEILAALPEDDRADVEKAMKDGYSPVLFVDLLSGATAIEMRKYLPPSPQVRLRLRQGGNGLPTSLA